jgi:hypothetical protein
MDGEAYKDRTGSARDRAGTGRRCLVSGSRPAATPYLNVQRPMWAKRFWSACDAGAGLGSSRWGHSPRRVCRAQAMNDLA